MNIRIEAAQAGEIKLSPVLPSSLQLLQIPDTIGYGAAGPFGHVLIQQMEGEGITAVYHSLFFAQGDQVTYRSDEPAIRLQIILRNSYNYDSVHLGKGVLHERSINLNFVPLIDVSLKLRPGATYNHLSVFYRKEHLLALLSSFPLLLPFLAKTCVDQPALFGASYTIADAAILSVVDNILGCTYSGHVRELYTHYLCTELLLLSLIRLTSVSTSAVAIGEEDAYRIYRAKELLLQDMGSSTSLSSLAEETGLSIYKLNHGFKSIYGIGATEFLHESRMKRAHQALSETDMTISVIAKASGYSHPHAFALAFKKYFGYTPAFVQRACRTSLPILSFIVYLIPFS
jgi:AraC-like DNA-binding protein